MRRRTQRKWSAEALAAAEMMSPLDALTTAKVLRELAAALGLGPMPELAPLGEPKREIP